MNTVQILYATAPALLEVTVYTIWILCTYAPTVSYLTSSNGVLLWGGSVP